MKSTNAPSLEIMDLNVTPVPEEELKKLAQPEVEVNAAVSLGRTKWLKMTTLQEDNIWFFGEKLQWPSGTFHFSLATEPAVTWWKGLTFFDYKQQQVLKEVSTQDNDHGPNKMIHTLFGTSSSLETTSLILSKAKVLGIHTDMYHYTLKSFLSLPDIQALHGCNHLAFLWMQDNL